MPLHKSSRASRLDPTMISAPLGDFRHTMHIGRGGDTFGDTSFLSTVGPSSSNPDNRGSSATSPPVETEVAADHVDSNEALQSEWVSSFTLDLDFDLGPSMLGDVLGVMDVLSPTSSVSSVEIKQGENGATERSVELRTELNGKNSVDENLEGDSRIPDGNGLRPSKGLRPKVRFSDKREEIIRQPSEEEEGQEFDFQDEEDELETPPSPASSHSSDYEGITALDRRKVDICHSETDSEEEVEIGKGYTFEDEFDDEIGL
uniref:CDC42 effector protein (Rho GTPase binding) 5 n=1 Tax=Neogobius melanostomus TaxID=47308 RepID=A0A8C6SYX8_9GOBI